MSSTYCKFVKGEGKDTVHRDYHDKEYGFSIKKDNELFAPLVHEINKSGRSWTTTQKKKENYYKAFDNFEVANVARYTAAKKNKLLQDPGIIRNRLKIEAAVHNAKQILALQKEYGSFSKWLDNHHPLPKEEWIKLF